MKNELQKLKNFQKIYLTTKNIPYVICMIKKTWEPIKFENYENNSIISLKVFDTNHILMGTVLGDIIYYDVNKKMIKKIFIDGENEIIQYMQTWMTCAGGIPMFYSLSNNSKLVCRNKLNDDNPVFTTKIPINIGSSLLGIHTSIFLNVFIVVYSDSIYLVSPFYDKIIAKINLHYKLESMN